MVLLTAQSLAAVIQPRTRNPHHPWALVLALAFWQLTGHTFSTAAPGVASKPMRMHPGSFPARPVQYPPAQTQAVYLPWLWLPAPAPLLGSWLPQTSFNVLLT